MKCRIRGTFCGRWLRQAAIRQEEDDRDAEDEADERAAVLRSNGLSLDAIVSRGLCCRGGTKKKWRQSFDSNPERETKLKKWFLELQRQCGIECTINYVSLPRAGLLQFDDVRS